MVTLGEETDDDREARGALGGIIIDQRGCIVGQGRFNGAIYI